MLWIILPVRFVVVEASPAFWKRNAASSVQVPNDAAMDQNPKKNCHYNVISTFSVEPQEPPRRTPEIIRTKNSSKTEVASSLIQLVGRYERMWSGEVKTPTSDETANTFGTTSQSSLLETLALVSDVLVVELGLSRRTGKEDIIFVPFHLRNALRRGLEQREKVGAPPPRVILSIAYPPGQTCLSKQVVREQIMLQELPWVNENIVRDLDIRVLDEMDDDKDLSGNILMDEVLAEADEFSQGEGTMSATLELPFQGFPKLLQRIYGQKSSSTQELRITETRDEKHTDSIDKLTIGEDETRLEKKYVPQDIERILTNIIQDLEEQVERPQEEVQMDLLGDGVPIDFAAKVDPILVKLDQQVTTLGPLTKDQEYVFDGVANKVTELYQIQLDSLRDYCGRLYEKFLDAHEEQPSVWQQKAALLTDQFRKAAQSAVPKHSEKLLGIRLNYLSTLQGLVSDMMEATSIRQPDDESEGEGNDLGSSPRVKTWYEKLAGRALMLGINYLQGWLAWQGVKRAALDRERRMPKFPLF